LTILISHEAMFHSTIKGPATTPAMSLGNPYLSGDGDVDEIVT